MDAAESVERPVPVLAAEGASKAYGAVKALGARALAARGQAVIIISHCLPEIFEVTDRISRRRDVKTIIEVA